MKKILNTVGLMSLGIVALIAITVGGMMLTHDSAFAGGNRAYYGNGQGCGEPDWQDFDESKLTNKERLKNRPGNYVAIRRSIQFIHSMQAIEPEFYNIAFPFQKDGKVFEKETEDHLYGIVNPSKTNRYTKQNPWRLYNINIHQLNCIDFAEGESDIANPESYHLSERDVERFKEVRKAHNERCVLTVISFTGESLESDITIGGADERGFVLCWVMKDDSWKLVWFAE